MASMYVFARIYPANRFAMFSSLMIGLGSIGNLLGAAPLAFAVEAYGWRASMGAISAVTALSCISSFLLVRDPPVMAHHGKSAGFLSGVSQILRLPALWPILPLALVSYAVVIALRSLWIAPFFAQVHGFDVTQRGNAAFLMALAMSLGALAYAPAERLLDDPKITSLIGGIVTGLALVMLGSFGDASAGVALVLLCAIGAAGLSYGILMAHARMFFPAALLGRGVTFMNFVFIAGAGLVQWLSGRFVQGGLDAHVPAATTFGQLHLAFGGCLLLACAIYAFSPARPKT
jgi:predicted MFS family arabinose efflux permease